MDKEMIQTNYFKHINEKISKRKTYLQDKHLINQMKK